MTTFDLLLQNGKIVDGTGKPAFLGDVGIVGNKIVAISGRDGTNRLTGDKAKALRVVDCTGKLITPGWVDVHTHLDGQITWDPLITPLSGGGVTTAIQGNCGVGFAPCKKDDRKFLMELMEGVEDIPLGALDQGIKWEWETFSEYLDALEKKSFAIDIGAMITHGPVRAYILGKRANASDRPGGPKNDPLTSQEIERIASVVEDGIRSGALGFSTSRTLLHRDRSGVLVPGTLATEEELLKIGEAIAKGGNGKAVFEMASDFMTGNDEKHTPENHAERLKHFGREFLWMKTMSKGFGVPLMYCLGLPSAAKNFGYGYRQMLRTVESANAEGCDIRVQVFTRPQGVLLSFDSRSHPFTESAAFDAHWRSTKNQSNGSFDKRSLKLNPQLRRKVIDETIALAAGSSDTGNFGMTLPQSTDDDGPGNLNASITVKGALSKMYSDNPDNIFRWTKTYEPAPETSVGAEAKRRGVHPLEVLYDWMCEDECSAVITYLFMNYAHQTLEDCREMLLHPNTVPGLGDTGAHLGFLSDPTSPSYFLTHWYRDRTSGPKFPLEFAVKRHSKDTANAFFLSDRGSVEVGLLADVNVIDLDKLEILKPRFVRDLPLGAGRWIQEVVGYVCTVKSGVITYENGVPTGNLPGRLVRRRNQGAGAQLAVPNPTVGAFNQPLGRLRMMLSTAKWEGEQKVLETMISLLGPERLEKLGVWLNERRPLTNLAKI